jgi:hypothetical protein
MSFLENYVPVQDRINQFRSEYPEGVIKTEMIMPSPFMWGGDGAPKVDEAFDHIVFKASLWRDKDRAGMEADATGWAHEMRVRQGRTVNVTSWIENCETSAIGRALANLGYATSQEDRPSREEMEKVERLQQALSESQYEVVERNNMPSPVRQQAPHGERKITIQNPGSPPSPAQQNMARARARERGLTMVGEDGRTHVDQVQLDEFCMEHFNDKTFVELNKGEMSQLIDKLGA